MESDRFEKVRGIALQLSSGPTNWLELADFLKEVQSDESQEQYGFKTFPSLYKDGLGLSPAKVTQLKNALKAVKSLDPAGLQESLSGQTPYKLGYGVCQKLQGTLKGLASVKNAEADIESLKESFTNGTLTQATIQAVRVRHGLVKPLTDEERLSLHEDRVRALKEKIQSDKHQEPVSSDASA